MEEQNNRETLLEDYFYQAATLEQNKHKLNSIETITCLNQFQSLYDECKDILLFKAKLKANDEMRSQQTEPEAAGIIIASGAIGGLAGVTYYLSTMDALTAGAIGISASIITGACIIHNLNKREEKQVDYSISNPDDFNRYTNYFLDELLSNFGIQPCYDRIMEQFKDYKINLDEKTKVYQKSL